MMHDVNNQKIRNFHTQNRIIHNTDTYLSFPFCSHIRNSQQHNNVHLSRNKSVKTSRQSSRLHSSINSIKATKTHKRNSHKTAAKKTTIKKRRRRRYIHTIYLLLLTLFHRADRRKRYCCSYGVCGLSTSDNRETKQKPPNCTVLYIILPFAYFVVFKLWTFAYSFLQLVVVLTPSFVSCGLRPAQTNDIIMYTCNTYINIKAAHTDE